MSEQKLKQAVIALLEQQVRDLRDDAVPIGDYYVSFRDTYRFDVTREEAEKFAKATLRQKNKIRKD